LPIRRRAAPGLPRRHSQAHLEPQLREPGGSGTGTPFMAFVPAAVPDGSGNPWHAADDTVEQPVVTEDAEPGARRAGAGARVARSAAATRGGARVDAQHPS
jgi:hypothetical protein